MAEFDEAIERVVAGLQRRATSSIPRRRKPLPITSRVTLSWRSSCRAPIPFPRFLLFPGESPPWAIPTQLPTEDRYLMTRSELLARIDVL